MKKIHLAILLAASLNLANAYVMQTYHEGDQLPSGYDYTLTDTIPNWVTVYGSPLGVSSKMCDCRDNQLIPDGISGMARPYTIHNNKSSAISGFKFYHYFNAPPSKNFTAHLYHYFYANRSDRGKVMIDNAIQPRRIDIERLSAVQYRAVLDFSNINIPAHTRFPTTGAMYIRIESTDPDAPLTYVSDWARPGHELSGFAITSKSGTVLYGPELNNNGTKTHPTVDNARRVGLLTEDSELCQNEKAYAWIMMDTEDTNPTTRFDITPRPNGISVYPNKNVGFSYCAQAFTSMPKVPFDYIVLKMDTTCPSGSYEFVRIHDTENSGNINTHTGDVWPSIAKAGENMKLEYCLVTKNSSSTRDYPVNKAFSVFANYQVTNKISRSRLFIQDERSNNQNSWDWREMSSSRQTKVQNIIYGDYDTRMYAIKWIGGGLAKSEAKVVMDNKSATTTEISHAPAIRGFDHSAVSVELQSAGYAKVTIANAKGAVVAKIVKEGLQPGVHQIEWNSGIVPNGIYIVTVEHNGKIAAKNVILR